MRPKASLEGIKSVPLLNGMPEAGSRFSTSNVNNILASAGGITNFVSVRTGIVEFPALVRE